MARYDLALSDEEFYSLTMGHLKALMRREEYERTSEEFLAAQIAAAVINFSPVHPKERIEARDLMPSMAERPARKRDGGDALGDDFRHLFAVMKKVDKDSSGRTASHSSPGKA